MDSKLSKPKGTFFFLTPKRHPLITALYFILKFFERIHHGTIIATVVVTTVIAIRVDVFSPVFL